jgi:hypothetical protein
MLVVGRLARPRAALSAALSVCVAISFAFVVAGRQAAARVDAAADHFSGWTTLDRILMPLPMKSVLLGSDSGAGARGSLRADPSHPGSCRI